MLRISFPTFVSIKTELSIMGLPVEFIIATTLKLFLLLVDSGDDSDKDESELC